MPRAQRVQYARDILQKELLPHVGQAPHCEGRKAFYLGYIVSWTGCDWMRSEGWTGVWLRGHDGGGRSVEGAAWGAAEGCS